MTTLDVDVADVETARPAAARPAGSSKALSYLKESGASPICLAARDGVCKFTFGKVDKNAAETTWWIAAADARAVVVLARKLAGASPDVDKATAALHEAVRQKRATLTSGQVALERAQAAAERLDSYFEAMRRSGQLQIFNQVYRRRRLEAVASGRGFMSWSHAMARLRAALIPMLIGGQSVAPQSLFASIFDPK
jgi:hypothetical protein